jgi:hypothetical protein
MVGAWQLVHWCVVPLQMRGDGHVPQLISTPQLSVMVPHCALLAAH